MNIKKIVGGFVNKGTTKEEFTFSSENYKMKEIYDAEKLVVGKLEYISGDAIGVVSKKTIQKYIFEPVLVNGLIKYQEVFTGFLAGNEAEGYFNLPYVVDLEELTEILEIDKQAKISKFSMLLVLDDVNSKRVKCKNKNTLNRRKRNK